MFPSEWQPRYGEYVRIEGRLTARVVELWPERQLALCRVGPHSPVWLPFVILSPEGMRAEPEGSVKPDTWRLASVGRGRRAAFVRRSEEAA